VTGSVARHGEGLRSLRSGALVGLVSLAACGAPSDQKLRDLSQRIESAPAPSVQTKHVGPGVAVGATGTFRFARFVFPAFRKDRAMETARFADRWYREPGNEGFEAVIDHVRAELEEAGYGREDHLRLEVIPTSMEAPAWTPRRARVRLLVAGAPDRMLHEFARPEDPDRTMLPTHAPSANVEGPVALGVERARAGAVVATAEPLTPELLRRAKAAGAVAVISAALAPYNVDPTPAARHLDAIAYASAPADCPLPAAMISPRSLSIVQEACASSRDVGIALEAEVELADRPLRTLVATVEGAEVPGDAVVVPAHVQEPGACDNASGVATVLEDARLLAELVLRGDLELPRRSIAFVFGQEMEQSRVWIEKSGRRAIAAVAADMTGESRAETGASPLLERMPDPGAVHPLPPDVHTAWGASPVDAASLAPAGLSVIARSALVDVGTIARGWETREHPYEGGSDHSVFLGRGVPAVLFWHFPDFAYHTSLDRLSHVDPEEMRRTGSAILATALATADARAFDMERYLESLRIEQELRLSACERARDGATAELWKAWCKGARLVLADLCLGPARSGEPDPAPARPKPTKPSEENP